MLLERSEIDKSLKALENLVTVLYEYTQLTSSLAGMDKKLTKALKEASGMKRGAVSGDISGGAVDWPCKFYSSIFSLVIKLTFIILRQSPPDCIEPVRRADKS